jgi:heavy metal sensor kinase
LIKRWIRSVTTGLAAFLNSIRFRITLWFVLILAVVLAAFSVFIFTTETRDLRVDAVGHMQEKFLRVQNYFRNPEWRLSDLTGQAVPGEGQDSPLQKGDLLMLINLDGSVAGQWGTQISQPDSVAGALVAAGASQRDTAVYEKTVPVADTSGAITRADYLFTVTPVLQEGHLVGFLVIGSPSDLIGQQARLAESLILGSLAMLVIAFLGGLWLADRAMRPVAKITRAARQMSESDLQKRLNLRGRDELAALGRTFDDMLARLQAAFERQRRFVADASHELRTPLTIINLEVARALSARHSNGDTRKALEVVEAEGGRMTRLVNDLMTLARMDSGQAILQFSNVDLGEIALEAIERMAPLAEQRGIVLEAGDLPVLRVSGDPQYLLQMISNLVENGIKYCEPGQKVRVEARSETPSIVLSVADTGPGIPQEHLHVVFDRFYRVDAARTGNDKEQWPSSGSGLGLSIVAWIVKAHHGTIDVSSAVNQGTTFRVTLPAQ